MTVHPVHAHPAQREVIVSYFRGRNYVWRDGTHVHFWCAGGNDGWSESGWADAWVLPTVAGRQGEGGQPSGVGVPQEVMDDYVLLRFAELVEAGLATVTLDRALDRARGNGGSMALEALQSQLRPLIASVPVAPPSDQGQRD